MTVHGTGAIKSPPDDRDLVVTPQQLQRLAGAIVLPDSYRLPSRPPITDQGPSPMCVAYSCAYEQNEQDQREHGRFYDFNESAFFWSIGGTINGAVMRYGLNRMLDYGYPEQDATPSSAQHKIDGYFRVDVQDSTDIKRAIIQFGGVLVIMQWFASWEHPYGSTAILPAPSGSVSGHAFWAVGWDNAGHLIGQQTWGSAWGDNGLFRMPWSYVKQYAWEVWKTADDLTLQTIAKARIKEQGTELYKPKRVIGDDQDKLLPEERWGQARKAGIYRYSTGSLVAKPWDKAFKYKGRRHGARHGFGNRSETWAILGIAGTDVAVPAPLVRLVT